MKRKKIYMSVGVKLVGFYVLFGFIPLLIAGSYTLGVLRTVLEEDSYRYISQETEQMRRLVDSWTDQYSVMIDSIYMDFYINAYISADYAEKGYEEMYPYIDKTLLRLSLICPEYTDIEFYSFNETLPEDGNYFHEVSEMKEGWFEKAVEADGFTVVAGLDDLRKKDASRPGICLVKLMNYFKNGSLQNILLLRVDAYSMSDMLYSQDDICHKLVLDQEDTILASSDHKDVGRKLEDFLKEKEIQGEVDWSRPGSIWEQDVYYFVTQDCSLGLRVLAMVDKMEALRTMTQTTRRILILSALLFLLAVSAILVYGKNFTARISRIVYATERMQEERFDYYIREKGNDEIGKLADAMDELTMRMKVLIHDNYEKKLMLQDSEISLLYEQIDPHFLYNALSTITSLSMIEGDRMTARCVKALGEFYRVSLNQGKRILTVQDETELLKSYMVIQKLRFEDSVEISYEIPDGVKRFWCPKLLLQPVVENSIKYGIRDNNGETLHIRAEAFVQDGKLVFVITDDGVGMDRERLEEVREAIRQGNGGYGLKNIDVRIRLQYGEEYGLWIDSEKGGGTRVEIRIPCIEEPDSVII